MNRGRWSIELLKWRWLSWMKGRRGLIERRRRLIERRRRLVISRGRPRILLRWRALVEIVWWWWSSVEAATCRGRGAPHWGATYGRRPKAWPHPCSPSSLGVDVITDVCRFIVCFHPSFRKWRRRVPGPFDKRLLCTCEPHGARLPFLKMRFIMQLEVFAELPATPLLFAASSTVMSKVCVGIVVEESRHNGIELSCCCCCAFVFPASSVDISKCMPLIERNCAGRRLSMCPYMWSIVSIGIYDGRASHGHHYEIPGVIISTVAVLAHVGDYK